MTDRRRSHFAASARRPLAAAALFAALFVSVADANPVRAQEPLVPIRPGQFKADLYLASPLTIGGTYFVNKNVGIDGTFGFGSTFGVNYTIFGVGGSYYFELAGAEGEPSRLLPYVGLRYYGANFSSGSTNVTVGSGIGVVGGAHYRFNNQFSAGLHLGSVSFGIGLSGSYWFK